MIFVSLKYDNVNFKLVFLILKVKISSFVLKKKPGNYTYPHIGTHCFYAINLIYEF